MGFFSFFFKPFPDPPKWEFHPYNSMHFTPYKAYSEIQQRLPEGYKIYEFSSCWEEDDPDVLRLADEIMTKLCAGRQVLTHLWVIPPEPNDSFPFKRASRKRIAESKTYLPACQEILKERLPKAAIELHDDWNLAIMTQELPSSTLFLCENDSSFIRWFDTYLLPDSTYYPDAKAALACALDEGYDMKMEKALGPKSLYITFNKNAVQLEEIQEVIRDICQKDGRRLCLDSDEWVNDW